MRRHWIGGMLLGLVAGCGATPTNPQISAQPPEPDREAAVIIDGKGVHLVKVNGQPGRGETGWGLDPKTGWARLPPGVHTIEVRYYDGYRYSRMNAEITFVTEVGHVYRAEDWPPKLVDIGTGRPAPQKLRPAE